MSFSSLVILLMSVFTTLAFSSGSSDSVTNLQNNTLFNSILNTFKNYLPAWPYDMLVEPCTELTIRNWEVAKRYLAVSKSLCERWLMRHTWQYRSPCVRDGSLVWSVEPSLLALPPRPSRVSALVVYGEYIR